MAMLWVLSILQSRSHVIDMNFNNLLVLVPENLCLNWEDPFKHFLLIIKLIYNHIIESSDWVYPFLGACLGFHQKSSWSKTGGSASGMGSFLLPKWQPIRQPSYQKFFRLFYLLSVKKSRDFTIFLCYVVFLLTLL